MPQGMKSAQLQGVAKATVYNAKRLLQYTPEEIDHCERSQAIRQYIDAKRIQAKNTAITYKTRMQAFSQFVFKRFNRMEVDLFIEDLKNKGSVLDAKGQEDDPYDVLTSLGGFLREKKGITGKPFSSNFIRACVKTARKFLRFERIKVAIEDFNELVPLPRKERPSKNAIEKQDVCRYLNACKNLQLKSALHMLSATGPRPIEACAVRESDIDLASNPETVTFHAEHSKMRVARTRPLTKEAANQFRLWMSYKYRTRRTTVKDEKGRYVQRVVTPNPDPDALFLAMPRFTGRPTTPEGLYDNLAEAFANLVDMVDSHVRKKGERRKVSLKTFRDFVKSQIADLGYSDFSEWMIGHAGSVYYQKSQKEIVETFRKIEHYISYLDIASLEARGATVEAKLDASEARFQQLLAQNARQQQENALLAAVVLAQSEPEKAAAAARLRAFHGLDDNSQAFFEPKNLEVLDRVGGIAITQRPKVRSDDGRVQFQRLGAFTVPETGETRLFLDVPPDIESVEFRNRKQRSKKPKKSSPSA